MGHKGRTTVKEGRGIFPADGTGSNKSRIQPPGFTRTKSDRVRCQRSGREGSASISLLPSASPPAPLPEKWFSELKWILAEKKIAFLISGVFLRLLLVNKEKTECGEALLVNYLISPARQARLVMPTEVIW